nr:hypothetical protein [Tanacetum cinerariifolium]
MHLPAVAAVLHEVLRHRMPVAEAIEYRGGKHLAVGLQ